MQVNDFNENIEHYKKMFNSDAFEKSDSDFDLKAEKIKDKTTNLPEGARTPTAAELKGMSDFAEQYRNKNPKASKREVRRAVQKKFNVKLLPNT